MNNLSKASTDDHTSNKELTMNTSTDDTSNNTSHDHHHQNREHNKEFKAATAAAQLYNCTYCKRGFTTAQALGGHMNIHRKDRAAKTTQNNASSSSGERPLELRLFDDKPKGTGGDRERSEENEATDELDLTLRLGHEK